MTTHIAAITFDCAFARLAAGDGGHPGPSMMFIQVPEPKTVKNRTHLDLGTHDREAEVERLLSLGASHVHDKDEWGMRWTTLADPEGNEFCIAEH